MQIKPRMLMQLLWVKFLVKICLRLKYLSYDISLREIVNQNAILQPRKYQCQIHKINDTITKLLKIIKDHNINLVLKKV